MPRSVYRMAPCLVWCVGMCLCHLGAWAQYGAGAEGEWRAYGGDRGNTKYSPLDQINEKNVGSLKIDWRWSSENFGSRPDFNLEATPIMVAGVLYTTAGSDRDVVAIDGASGETLWTFHYPESRSAGAAARRGSGRGVAYWADGADERIFLVTRGYRLIALDAHSGRRIEEFGEGGVVDLKEGLGRPVAGGIGSTSPPVIANDILVVGSSLAPYSLTQSSPPGHIRGFDPKTGRQLWIFHTIPQAGESGNDTWENGSWKYTGNTGAWTILTADEELGYVYLPLETATNDFYGGHRLGDTLFAESLVCLDIKTGKRIWHFQTVHHGIWDYDLPAAPILCDLRVDGRTVKAVAQITKQGFTFVFDRVTGEPLWTVEERAVPQTDVPGERTSPTQPFPTKPAPFDRQGISEDMLIDFTPELFAEAKEILYRYRHGPLYTPPSLIEEEGTKGTIQMPGTVGGANWFGAAFDPETGILYVPSTTFPQLIALTKPDANRSNMAYHRTGPMTIAGPQGLPLTKPPWGRVTAIDLNTGEHLWMVPNGDTPDFVLEHPALKDVKLPPTGRPGQGAPLLTKTLLFIGEGSGLYVAPKGAGGPMFYAYDKRTGEKVAELKLPANQTGAPMTYMLDGKQYIVIAVGAKDHPAEFVAFVLGG